MYNCLHDGYDVLCIISVITLINILFFQGTLRINQRDYSAAYVDDPVSTH